MSPAAVLPLLGALKWPLTIAGAVLVFGLSSEGTLSLVAANADKLVKPIAVSPSFNVPPVRQIGELTPVATVPKALKNDGGTAVPEGFAKSTTAVALTQPDPLSGSLLPAAPKKEPFLGTARIGSSAVKVRASATKSSASLGVLAAGTPVKIGERSGGWVRVQHEGGEGWVYSTYIDDGAGPKVASVTIRGGAERASEAPKASKGKLVEAGSRIVVRDAPDASGATVFRLQIGEKVRIVERKGEWSRIATASGEGGWIRVK